MALIVAAVVATSREAAADAAELVEVDYDPLPAVTSSMLSVPILQCAPDELTDRTPLAEGTMSTLERAMLNTLPVAVKTLKPPGSIADAATRQRVKDDFQNEYEFNAALRHPNIVLLIGCVRQPNLTSLIFELCDGGTLRCRDYGFSKLRDGLAVSLGVARALCYAHRLGIVHRDVKPSQVVFAGDVPKLADWGLASYLNPNKSCMSGETGTWEFMAPEVIRSEKYSSPADVYSFSVLLYCVVTGEEYPYRDKYLTPAQAAMAVARKDLRPTVSSRVPATIKQVLTMCWTSEPELRPGMDQVIAMLEQTCMQDVLERSVSSRRRAAARASSWPPWGWTWTDGFRGCGAASTLRSGT